MPHKPKEYQVRTTLLQVNSENYHYRFFIPRALSCVLQNSIFFFCHLAILVCLTYMIHKFLCLILRPCVLLCLAIVFQHSLALNLLFLLVSRIPSFCSCTIRFSSMCSCLSHYKIPISVPHYIIVYFRASPFDFFAP